MVYCALISGAKIPLARANQPVLHEEEAGDDEADVGDVVGVVAPEELHGDDGQVAEEVAQADRADGPRHPVVARRQLPVHVVAAMRRRRKEEVFL